MGEGHGHRNRRPDMNEKTPAHKKASESGTEKYSKGCANHQPTAIPKQIIIGDKYIAVTTARNSNRGSLLITKLVTLTKI